MSSCLKILLKYVVFELFSSSLFMFWKMSTLSYTFLIICFIIPALDITKITKDNQASRKVVSIINTQEFMSDLDVQIPTAFGMYRNWQ